MANDFLEVTGQLLQAAVETAAGAADESTVQKSLAVVGIVGLVGATVIIIVALL